MDTSLGDPESTNPTNPAIQENHAALACDRCKGRKIKCDRILPACTTCVKTTASCTYPLVSKKPGPKIGSSQRRRLRHSREPTASQDARSLQREGTVNRILRGLITRPSDLEARNNEQNISFTRQEASQNDVSELQIEAGNLPSPAATSEHSISRGLSLSQLIHPSHEPTSEPYSAPRPPVGGNEGAQLQVIIDICNDLGISVNNYRLLLDAYFVNMTAFSLFHQPTFDKKLLAISSSIQRKSLLASMFSFSVRFIEIDLYQNRYNSPKAFRDLAEQSITEALDECVDETPPLCILQAMVLTTFQQLANGVRGRSWRSMGTLVRIGYELQLHLIDKNSSYDSDQENDICSWSLDEERRRTWWAIWEFDVFASTIRRLPTAIDWSQNATWLPVDDKLWFNYSFQSSCHLNPDAAFAWKDLEKSGNKGPKAWFIVINALMRTAHIISHHQLYFNPNLRGQNSQGTYNLGQPPANDTQSVQSQLETLSNALYCFYVALPISLSFQGEFLSFSTSSLPGMPATLHEDSAKHSIHIMTQLSRFMLYHRQVFNNPARGDNSGINTPTGVRSVDHGSWSRYLNAAQDIINIIRNSSHKHVQYVNPFLVNTIWLAATAQIVSRLFGPPLNNPRLAESNLDLLQMNIDAYISFWGVSRTLQQKLKAIELRFETVLRRHADQQLGANRSAINSGGSPEQSQQLHRSNQSSTLNTISHSEAEDSMDYHPGASNGDEALRLDLWPLDVSGNISALDMPLNLYDFGLDEMLTYGT